MSDPVENPYSAPKAELGVTAAPPSTLWVRIRYLVSWTFLVLLNASAGFAGGLAIGFRSNASIFAMCAGVALIGTAYVWLDLRARRAGNDFLAKSLWEGAKARALFIVFPLPEAFAKGMAEGILGLSLPSKFTPYPQVTDPGTAFLLTILVGAQLAFMAFLLGMVQVVSMQKNT